MFEVVFETLSRADLLNLNLSTRALHLISHSLLFATIYVDSHGARGSTARW
jgi:hypothetical protein